MFIDAGDNMLVDLGARPPSWCSGAPGNSKAFMSPAPRLNMRHDSSYRLKEKNTFRQSVNDSKDSAVINERQGVLKCRVHK